MSPQVIATIRSVNSARHRIGRPPGPHDDTLAKLLPTAARLFVNEGAGALTPTRLHTETGVARATIYRNWPQPADLIEIMLTRATEQPPDDTFTGQTGEDLHRAAQLLQSHFERQPLRPYFAACMQYGQTSDRIANAGQAFIAGILAPFHRVLSAAVANGELTGDVDELTAEITGPLILDHVILGHTLTPSRFRAAVDHFIDHHLPPAA